MEFKVERLLQNRSLITNVLADRRVATNAVSSCKLGSYIENGDLVFISGGASTPNILINAMTEHGKANKLQNVRLIHMHTEGDIPYLKPEYAKIFRSVSLFMGKNVREAVAEGRADNMSIFLHEIPRLFTRKILKPDVAMVHVCPPDSHGYCSLGASVDCIRAGASYSKLIIAQINRKMPRTFGDGIIHKSHFDFACEVDVPLVQHPPNKLTEAETKIGKLIAENLVQDGATLQMGIGNIPDAVLGSLSNHKDLAIHSEMFANGVVDLVKKGAVTNRYKKIHRGKIVTSFLIGAQPLYDFVNDNPAVELLVIDYVNSISVISTMPRMTAINSCIEIDLTGQVCADSIGTRFFSGFGGQIDFIRGAAEASDGLGVPIIAMQSTTNKGETKIVPVLKEGAGVVTSRGHVHFIVTENGIAYLFGKNMRQRAHALIEIAHPKHRESLEKAAFARLKVMPSPD